ncbi:MAG: hypothetical protein QHJ73_17355, partial [Armatimonadota bacterium]|nr:hypothetical protein [Armatimonadota bacterium]
GLGGVGAVLPYLYLAGVGTLWPAHHWEDPTTLSGLVRLVLRVKYGVVLFGLETGPRAGPLFQVTRYLANLAEHFLWPAFALGLFGLARLAQRDRAFLACSGAGFLLGVAVVAKAHMDPRVSAFDAATLERLYLLPHFFFVLWVGVAMGVVGNAISRPPGSTWAAAGVLLVLPACLVARNAPHTSGRGNYLYPRLMENVLGTLPPGAVLLCWTDIVGLGVDAVQTVDRRRPDVPYVMMGLVGSEPYRSTVRRQYPELFWPVARPGEPFDLSRFLEENLRRHRIFLDTEVVPTEYPLVPYGILWEVLPYASRRSPEEIIGTNEALWRRYDLRQAQTTLYAPNAMCRTVVVDHYVRPRLALARLYERLGRHAEARRHRDACRWMDPTGEAPESGGVQ